MKAEVAVSVAAVYEKLGRVEPEVAAALVQHSGEKLGTAVEAMGGQMEPWLPGYRVRILTGTIWRLEVGQTGRKLPLLGHLEQHLQRHGLDGEWHCFALVHLGQECLRVQA